MSNLAKNPPSPVRSPTRGLHLICGRMTTAGASAPTPVKPAVGWTATRSAAGNILVTLDQAYKQVLHAEAHLIGATGNTKGAKIIATTNGGVRSGASFTIETQNTSGTAADQTGIDLTFACYAAQVK
jgi:hypothetical protein